MTARNVFCEALVCGQMVALAIFAITVNCQAAIFDDAKLRYREFSDRNANGKVDAGEIRDCLHAGNATDVRNQSDKLGYGDLGFSVEDVLCQYSHYHPIGA